MSEPEVNDEAAQSALFNGSKSSKVLTHPSMRAVEANPDASATDAENNDDYDWTDDNSRNNGAY